MSAPRRTYGLKKEILRDRVTRKSFSPGDDDSHLPPRHDLRYRLTTVFDQGDLGSCTANALCYIVQFLVRGAVLSRLFLYYVIRELEGTVSEDAGCTLRSGIQALTQVGACMEASWPYIISKFKIRPDRPCYTEALSYRIGDAEHVEPSETAIKSCLAAGFPIAVGIEVFAQFESDQVALTGRVPIPTPTEASLGNHAVTLIGYRDDSREFIVMNSWGDKWGDKGAFYLPYSYITNRRYLASDLWKIDLMRSAPTPAPAPAPAPVPRTVPAPVVPVVVRPLVPVVVPDVREPDSPVATSCFSCSSSRSKSKPARRSTQL